MTDLLSYLPEELASLLETLREPAYRAGQLYRWLHVLRAPSYEAMTNLPKGLREGLAANYPLPGLIEKRVQISAKDGTRKYLFATADSQYIESVYMTYHHGASVCISSQVGCRMGCSFCASALGGKVRNLSAGEMLRQLDAIARDTGERISHVVVMGTGEPLDNYEALVRFIRLLSDEKGRNLSQRAITVSTCGLVPEIYRLAQENFQINLALSLHAPTDTKRRKLMPIARKYTIAETLEAMDAYYLKTGRRLTFEYSLIHGINDTDADAEALAGLLLGKNCLVNLIPVNPVRETSFAAASPRDAAAFIKKLEKRGIHGTIRREMGRDIDGACGQLRRRFLPKEEDRAAKGRTAYDG